LLWFRPLSSESNNVTLTGERSIVLKGRVAHSRISDGEQENVTYRSGIEFIEASAPVDPQRRLTGQSPSSGR